MENQLETYEPLKVSTQVIRFALVRVVHAASTCLPIQIVIGNRKLIPDLSYGKVCQYNRITAGNRTVSIYSAITPRNLLLQTNILLLPGEKITLVFTHTPMGFTLATIKDEQPTCNTNLNEENKIAFLRVANFTNSINKFDLITNDFCESTCFQCLKTYLNEPGGKNENENENNKRLLSNIENMDISIWIPVIPGSYDFIIVRSLAKWKKEESNYENQTVIETFFQKIVENTRYTVYVIGGNQEGMAIQFLIVEN